jgi:hypothetical protein
VVEAMKMYEFTALDKEKQVESAHRGVFLSAKQEFGNHISLYNLDGFYVEVYHSIELDKVVMIRAFDSIDGLEPYLNDFNGEEFIKPF